MESTIIRSKKIFGEDIDNITFILCYIIAE